MIHQIVQRERVLSRLNIVNGFHHIKKLDCNLIKVTDEIIENWSDNYNNSDEGFGSSDFTYLLKDIIDTCIDNTGSNLKSVFTPFLSVIER